MKQNRAEELRKVLAKYEPDTPGVKTDEADKVVVHRLKDGHKLPVSEEEAKGVLTPTQIKWGPLPERDRSQLE